jgi:AraC-like DNA-binding protein
MITNFNPNEMDLPIPYEDQGSSLLQPNGKQVPTQLNVHLSEVSAFFERVASRNSNPIRVFVLEHEALLLNGTAYVSIQEICAKFVQFSEQVHRCNFDVYLGLKTLSGLRYLSVRMQECAKDSMAAGQKFRLNSIDKCQWYQLVSLKPCPPVVKDILEIALPYKGQVWVSDQPKLIEVLLPLCTIGATESYEPSAFMKSLLHSIDLQFTNGHFGIDQLAASLHISRAQLFRKVKAELQIAPHDFLFEMRMEAAWVLVTRTDLNIGKIYSMIGFTSDSYFHQAFKRHYGVHPNAIRKAIQESL